MLIRTLLSSSISPDAISARSGSAPNWKTLSVTPISSRRNTLCQMARRTCSVGVEGPRDSGTSCDASSLGISRRKALPIVLRGMLSTTSTRVGIL